MHQHTANSRINGIHMHLKRFVKLWEVEHGQEKQLALEFSKGLVIRLIPLLDYHFLQQVGQRPSNLRNF